MKTGFAALKFGASLALIPFSFVYAPALLLQGDWVLIVATTLRYLLGYVALAMALQGTEFLHGRIEPWQRGLFILAAAGLLIPTAAWVDIASAAGMAIAWAPNVMRWRLARAAS